MTLPRGAMCCRVVCKFVTVVFHDHNTYFLLIRTVYNNAYVSIYSRKFSLLSLHSGGFQPELHPPGHSPVVLLQVVFSEQFPHSNVQLMP